MIFAISVRLNCWSNCFILSNSFLAVLFLDVGYIYTKVNISSIWVIYFTVFPWVINCHFPTLDPWGCPIYLYHCQTCYTLLLRFVSCLKMQLSFLTEIACLAGCLRAEFVTYPLVLVSFFSLVSKDLLDYAHMWTLFLSCCSSLFSASLQEHKLV